jgi:radical SAM superfamily enzyme YgiQ (UPF0313 family)
MAESCDNEVAGLLTGLEEAKSMSAIQKALLVNPRQSDAARETSSKCLAETAQMMGRDAATPPLGLLTVAALLPADWSVVVVDENVRPVTEAEWNAADIVMVTGYSDQVEAQGKLLMEGRRRGKRTVAGGGWASFAPEHVRTAGADFVVVDEAETGLPLLFAEMARGAEGGIIKASESADVTRSPAPRFDLLDMNRYVMTTMQFSRGCPYRCEFCDIIEKGIGGKVMRAKTPTQFLAELDALRLSGWRGAVFIADDNFIGDRRRIRELLPQMAAWMRQHDYPFTMSTEASINLARDEEMMRLMVEAGITKVFMGIESVDEAALRITKKPHNLHLPIHEACGRLARAGIEVHAALILGFDGETKGAGERLLEMLRQGPVANADLNLLYALPQAALWKRLEREGRLLVGPDMQGPRGRMNFRPLRPMDEVLGEALAFYRDAFEPADMLDRAHRQHRELAKAPGRRQSRPSAGELRGFAHVAWRYGVKHPFRWRFWAAVLDLAPRNLDLLWSFLRALTLAETHISLKHVAMPVWQTAIADLDDTLRTPLVLQAAAGD